MLVERNINSNLPEELVNEILLRLPVKTLLVCKCVCKKWCGLIKSSSFVKQHFSHESNQEYLLFQFHNAYTMYKDDGSHSPFEGFNHLPRTPTDGTIAEVMGPENGVFCVVRNRNLIRLLNPATREFRTLPPLASHDPDTSYPVIGFGLDPSSGDFKVVAFGLFESKRFAFVYNLSSDSWKRIKDVEALDLCDIYYYYKKYLILNGVYHWIMKFVNRDSLSILAFDMKTEKFQEISIPDPRERHLRLTAYGDSLAVMSFKDEARFDLWLMGSEGSWSKCFRIGPFRETVYPLCVWKKNIVSYTSSWTALMMWDISTQKVRTLALERDQKYVCNYFIYKESLVSIKGERVDRVQDS